MESESQRCRVRRDGYVDLADVLALEYYHEHEKYATVREEGVPLRYTLPSLW